MFCLNDTMRYFLCPGKKIRIRGANSISKSNDPLYVVDGIVRESGLDGI